MILRRRSPQQSGDEHLRALGRIAADLSLLEQLLTISVWNLIGSQTASVITDGISFRGLLKLFEALVRHHVNDPAVRKRVRGWCKRAQHVAEKRNQMLHSMWAFDGMPVLPGDMPLPSAGAVRTKLKALGAELERTSVKELDSIAREIRETALALVSLKRDTL